MKDAASSILVGAVEGTYLTHEELVFFEHEQLAGVTLFRRNIDQTAYKNTKNFCQSLQLLSPGLPMMIAVDQEGGRVGRFGKDFPDSGPPLKLSTQQIKNYASNVGKALLEAGINVDFAPVVDIHTEPTNTAIGDRCFGSTAESVAGRAGAFLDGLQSTGVMGCLKHFPGQGDAKVDTHLGKAEIPLSLQTLWEREMRPFRELCRRAPMVMISHSIYPVIDHLEAGRSKTMIETWLRGRLGFDGVVVSDDLNMGALPQDIQTWRELLVEALMAGCDMLLVCRHLDRCAHALDALRVAARKSASVTTRLEQAATRVTALRRNLV
jgi:beta-N-acetylhexosaminidase